MGFVLFGLGLNLYGFIGFKGESELGLNVLEFKCWASGLRADRP